ncbi:MAG: Holliday junction DNA helicase RuvB [bacterium]
MVDETLTSLGIDEKGLDRLDRDILKTMIHMYSGGPVGVDSLAATLSEEKDTIEDVAEPFLLQQGMIKRTPRGRVATEKAYEHLGIVLKP